MATITHRWATAKTVTATEVATDGTVVEDRWPPMDFPGLSTRESNNFCRWKFKNTITTLCFVEKRGRSKCAKHPCIRLLLNLRGNVMQPSIRGHKLKEIGRIRLVGKILTIADKLIVIKASNVCIAEYNHQFDF